MSNKKIRRQYILRTWYPSLPIAWKHAEDDIVVTKRGNEYINNEYNNDHIRLTAEEVENSAYYWEKIKNNINLVVPVGSQFITPKYKENNRTYTIDKREGDFVWVTWINDAGQPEDLKYKITAVNEFFNENIWEVVKPYNILSFRYSEEGFDDQYTTLRSNGKYVNSYDHTDEGCYTLEETMEQNHWDIYSVKRMSDGEVFTIGDYVRATKEEEARVIKSFTLEEDVDGLWINLDDIWETSVRIDIAEKRHVLLTTEDGHDILDDYDLHLYYVNLTYSHWVQTCDPRSDMANHPDTVLFIDSDKADEYLYEHMKEHMKKRLEIAMNTKEEEPLLVTEDGVDIFEGDTVYYVLKEKDQSLLGSDYFTVFHAKAQRRYMEDFDFDACLYFSTEYKANEWLDENRIIFTTEDGVDIHEGELFYEATPDGVFTVYEDHFSTRTLYKTFLDGQEADGRKAFGYKHHAEMYYDKYLSSDWVIHGLTEDNVGHLNVTVQEVLDVLKYFDLTDEEIEVILTELVARKVA